MVGGIGVGAGRSTAIVLFTDLVGSTELRSRLGEDAAEEVRRNHDHLVVDVIEANRGRLVKNLGDGVMATFAGASDAVAAAVRIQQALDRHNRGGSAVLLEVRIGLSAGDVAVDEGDCFGTPVVEAARLCAAAQGGQILASEVMRWLAGAGHGFTPVGSLQLKGLPQPVPALQVDWEPFPGSSVPLPALLTDIGRIFVGRAVELERLGQLWKEALAGERRVALLAGEPGVGKTRLAAELAKMAHSQGAVVMAGRCDEDLGVPYQPFVEALRHFVDHTPAEHVRKPLGRYGGELARLVPELVEQVPGLASPLRSDPETERYRLFDAVAAWLAAASAEEPVLLVLDDLQWAAKPTLLLLRHVVRSADLKRVLVLGTYRDTELAHDHPLIEIVADLRREGGVTRLGLTGLDDVAVATFVEQAAGRTLGEDGPAFVRAIYAETEGNPFFVRELLRHLAETGAVERQQGGWTTRLPIEELGIPEGVRDLVGRRLSLLSKEANRVLRAAAVIGAEFNLGVLREAEVAEEDDLVTALEEATSARLVVEVAGTAPRYRFAHALVRDTLYQGLSAARRTTLHRRVAEAIEAVHGGHLDDHLPALAYHWARASAPAAETQKAIDYAVRAGDRALAQLAHDEAVAYYGQALELLAATEGGPDEARRLEVLLAFGEAQRRAGEPAHRETLLAAGGLAQERGDAGALARAALSNTRAMFMGNFGWVDAERVEVLEAALAAAGEADTVVRARLLATLALELTFAGQGDRHFSLSDEALATARRWGDPATLAGVLLARYYTIYTPATLAERLANTAELLQIARGLEDPVTRCRAAFIRLRCLAEIGDLEEAARCFEMGEGLAVELGQPALLWTAAWNRVGRLAQPGRLDEAESAAHDAFELGRASGQPDANLFFAAQMYCLRREWGRVGEMEETLRETAEQWPGLPFLHVCVAHAYCAQGRDANAHAIFDPIAASRFAGLPFDLTWTVAMSACTDVAIHLGHLASAAVLYELGSPYADQVVVTAGVTSGTVDHYLGRLATTLGRFDEAQRHFAAAESTHARIGAPTWLARTQLECAHMLLARRQPGDAERARELLGQALSTAREHGLGNVERRAVTLLTSR